MTMHPRTRVENTARLVARFRQRMSKSWGVCSSPVIMATLMLALCACSPQSEDQPQALSADEQIGQTYENPFEQNASTTTMIGSAESETLSDEALGEDSTPSIETQGYPLSEAATAPEQAPASTGNCSDGKRVCGDMESCEDAMFHHQQCGLSRLDGDKDGVPCEKLCG